MSNTVITNYTDLNGPSTKADSSVVVIVNKDGSLSVDQNLLGTLMGTDGSQSAGISVVRVGHEGKPDDATDSESEDDKIPHVTLTVDSYYDEPNSIIKYDSGAEMLQSLRIETRENSLVGFQNDHCYTPLTSPSQVIPQRSETFAPYDDPVIEISHTPPPKPVPSSKKITILEQQIIPKGKKLHINPPESPIILKGNANDVLHKPLPVVIKTKDVKEAEKVQTRKRSEESTESSSMSSSGDSLPDRDSDSDYKDRRETSSSKQKKSKSKPRILKNAPPKPVKAEHKATPKPKPIKTVVKKEVKEVKPVAKPALDEKDPEVDLESLLPISKIVNRPTTIEFNKTVIKPKTNPIKKEKKTPAHVTALLSDMTSLFSSPDVIRRVSTDNKTPGKPDKDVSDKKLPTTPKPLEICEGKIVELTRPSVETPDKPKITPKTPIAKKFDTKVVTPTDKAKGYDLIPQLDDVSLAQILQDTTGITNNPVKTQASITTTAAAMNSPGLAGPLSPTLDLLGGLQPEEEGLTEDLLMHVAQLVESSENLQEVIDKQVLGKVDTVAAKTPVQTLYQPVQAANMYAQSLAKSSPKTMAPRKEPIEIVRRDGRVITLPPIEAPATRSSKRKSQMETSTTEIVAPIPPSTIEPVGTIPEPIVLQQSTSKQYINKKLLTKKQEPQASPVEKMSAESQESWNSEDDPNRLWCICKQPHNNRFMICCDGCEDWFHGKCVNITKAMGQQMEEQGIEWRCPNCIKKTKGTPKPPFKTLIQKKIEPLELPSETPKSPLVKEPSSKTSCIVCKKAARSSSIYCSNACILKHAQDSLGHNAKQDAESEKTQDKKSNVSHDSTVIVYERKSGRLLAGPNAPTAGNLKSWLQKNPTFEVVRPGTLSTIKPTLVKKKSVESNKIQTTLNFERIPRKSAEQLTPRSEGRDDKRKVHASPKPELGQKTPLSRSFTKSQPSPTSESPKPSTSTARSVPEPRKLLRQTSNRHQSTEKPTPSPSTPRRKDSSGGLDRSKMNSTEPIRDNVRKSLQEQLSLRMAEAEGVKFTEDEIQQFANETELELHDLFKDVGMKYKAKYRSLMFNIKDRKNLTLWEKICDKTITPKQLVRLSPEELASQELAEWRDQEAKHQLELIKKSELDLLAASKTYVLKTHKGEEVMETKESISTELDPNVPVEDVVIALNDSTVGEEVTKEVILEGKSKSEDKKESSSSKKREREDSGTSRSKKSRRDSKRESDRKHSSRRRSSSRDRDSKDLRRRSTRRHSGKKPRTRSSSRDRSKRDSKEKSGSVEMSRHRSRSREKQNKRSKSRDRSRSTSKGRERSRTRDRSRHRTRSRDISRRRRSASKHISADDHPKHRSRSQDNTYNKNKTDSTDSDSIERPKSASLKDQHPEYDPHEPMITSANSEEDLRKSEDAYDVNYKSDIDTSAVYDPSKAVYDPSKTFALDSNIMLPNETFTPKTDKISEPESDQEPSSTVENAAATIWNGCINMVDVARFYVSAHEVSGSAVDLEEDLSTELDIVGRINPETVWDYIAKTKKTSNKDIVILKLQAANDEEKMQYIALYSYLSSRSRLGVVKVPNTTSIKDFYIVPLPANTALQPVLLPLDGPGLGDVKTHLLIAIIVRQRKKRLAPHIPKDIIPSKVAKVSRKRSYTPPVVSKSTYTPPTSPRRRALPLPSYPGSALSTSVKDKIAASLACADDEEAYSPGSSNSSNSVPTPAVILPPSGSSLRTKMEELNRQIEEQKQQILKMAQADSSVSAEDEAYSPSRPMTPPVVPPALADIALPSNLHEILATIKQRTEKSTSDVDMRTMPLP